MLELYTNYKDAVRSSGVNNADDIAVEVMSTVLDRILLQFENPFTFPSYHQRMLEPYDYYEFGQNYVRPLIDYRNSYLGNIGLFDEIEGYLKQGENVILLSNHQTEADPAVIALLLETTHPFLAENLTYVAGDRVVLDPFCKPFSMGRNLLCVYSKKHLYDIPALAEMKRIANTRTLREMSALLRYITILPHVTVPERRCF
jgi:glycerol-3-phosphate O-acyltransferase